MEINFKMNIKPSVSIIMGSKSDWSVMKYSSIILEELKIPYETKIVSAHRTPHRLYEYAINVARRKIKVIIAGAGGAAHLPGMVASITQIPIIGVPINSTPMNGMDSLLSIVQMPSGIPVATMSIGKAGAKNASLYAAAVLANDNLKINNSLKRWRLKNSNNVDYSPVEKEQ